MSHQTCKSCQGKLLPATLSAPQVSRGAPVDEVISALEERIKFCYGTEKAKELFDKWQNSTEEFPRYTQLMWYHYTKYESKNKSEAEQFRQDINKLIVDSELCVIQQNEKPVLNTHTYFTEHSISPAVRSQELKTRRVFNFTLLEFERETSQETKMIAKTVLQFQIWLNQETDVLHFRIHSFCKSFRSELRLPGAVILDAYTGIIKCLFEGDEAVLEGEEWNFQSELEIVDLGLYRVYNQIIFQPRAPQFSSKQTEKKLHQDIRDDSLKFPDNSAQLLFTLQDAALKKEDLEKKNINLDNLLLSLIHM